MDAANAVVGGMSGVLTGVLVALGLKGRIDRLEQVSVNKDTCSAMHTGWSKQLDAIQADLTHQLDAMREASISAAKSSEYARIAAEKATDLSRAYIVARDEESKEWRDRMDVRLAEIEHLLKQKDHAL